MDNISDIGQPIRPTQPSIAPGSAAAYINALTWTTEVETIKTADQLLHVIVWLQAKVRDRGLELRPSCTPALSVTTAPLKRKLWCYINKPFCIGPNHIGDNIVTKNDMYK